jgi:chromosome segregation ATPase
MYLYVVFSLDPSLLALAKTFSINYENRLTALEKSMGQLSDAIASVKTSDDASDAALDQALARVQSEVDTFTQNSKDQQARIDALQAQVDAGGATPADIQALADLKTAADKRTEKLNALNPTNPTVLPPTDQGGTQGVGPPPVAPAAAGVRRG